MLDREPIINTEARLLILGEQSWDSYDVQAENSEVPESSAGAISALLSRYGNESYREVSEVIFGNIFNDEERSEVALRYMQAISTVKQAKQMDNERIGFERKVFLAIGRIAQLEEGAGEEIEEVKERVEEFFADPLNTVRFDYLSRQLFPQFNN